ncbi:MAG: HEAT repeat protein [Polaribacter sp.]|jgi:HEAT repeat protein
MILDNLINSLKTGNEKDRLYAIEELFEMPDEKAIPTLVGALVDMNGEIRASAEKLLLIINEEWEQTEGTKEAIPYLVTKLSSSADEVWKTASRWLAQLHPVALPALIETISQPPNDEVQWKAIQVIRQIKEGAESAVPTLIDALDNSNVTIKESVIRTLTETGSQNLKILGALSPLLEDGASTVRQAAAKAFGPFGSKAEEYSRLLVKRLLDKDSSVRNAAAESLTAIGQPAVKELLELIHQRADLRTIEIERLQRTKGDLFKGVDMETFSREPYKALQNVNWHLNDILEDLKRIDTGILHAIRILSTPDANDPKSIEPLVLALKDPNLAIRETALTSIGALGETAEETLPILLQLFKGEEITDYERIVTALNNIAPDWAEQKEAKPFQEHLIACLGEGQEEKLRAILALKKMDQAVVQTLIEGLENKDRIIREEVILLLGVLGEHAKAAIPILAKIAETDDNLLVRGAAGEVVKRIGF